MNMHLNALYAQDHDCRLTAINQWDGGLVPRFHLGRTATGNLWRFRADLPDTLTSELTACCELEPPLDAADPLPKYRATYERLLAEHAAIESIQAGPAYFAPESMSKDVPDTIMIDRQNAGLLRSSMPDWLEDAAHRSPFVAALDNDRIVAVCASVRITSAAHEAGVETLPGHRRRGHGRRAVVAWAQAVRRTGALPMYSTSWENRASQALARVLGFEPIGADYKVR